MYVISFILEANMILNEKLINKITTHKKKKKKIGQSENFAYLCNCNNTIL